MLADNLASARIIQQEEMKEITELKKVLFIHSKNNNFEDEEWILDNSLKTQSVAKGVKTLYFTSIPLKHKEAVKIFALVRLSSNKSVRTIANNIHGISKFLNYLLEELGDLPLEKVNKKVIYGFQEYLDSLPVAHRSKESIWTGMSSFCSTLAGYDKIPHIRFGSNPFSIPRHKRTTKSKYIEESILKQLDVIFEDEKIPLVYRTAYWICRLIPNRITEVASMRIGCIKPYMQERVISIPSFKQNGGHLEPEIKQIAVIEEGKGEFLLNLIRRQEEASKDIQRYMKDDEKNYLFTYFSSQYIPTQNKYKELIGNINKIAILNEGTFNRMIKVMCKRYNVLDERGEPVNLSSHMFRHNAITDRLYEGFRLVDIMAMTNHKSSTMITESYVHVQEDELRKKSEKILNEDKSEVLFRGKIINTENPTKASQILRRPFAHKIGRLGLCSDIRNCPSEMFECLSCENFVPNADELDHFVEQVEQWETKLNMFKDHPFMKENAEYNLKLHRNIVEKIVGTIEGVQ
ncbi:tyrosine-type recombinase/integrase [Bacillus badius]|uniref:tyrosine-type recombinase/integrase n=1 Tax=Bacillus badius TaxID=1455 RepID=UPI002E1C39F6|nr:tyrosine-type recombinase/integrase [Bacillus badius]MED0666066.1 tyrosine-type recombinase/integrase [Bacillus badius]